MGLSELLQSLGNEGQVDSRGAFTVSFDKAQEKLAQYQMSDPTRFLVPIVAGAVGLKAGAVDIQASEAQVSVELGSLYLSANELASHLYALVNAPENSPGQDLAFGLLGAFNHCPEGVEITSGAVGQESYRWKMGLPDESRQVLERSVTSTTILATKTPKPALGRLRSWLGGLGGYAGMTPECRWVDRLCMHSPIPIKINGQTVTRPYILPTGRGCYLWGSTPRMRPGNRKHMLTEQGSNLTGGVSLEKGQVMIGVRGVIYPGPKDLELTGLLYSDQLQLDLSREQYVRDSDYEDIISQLHDARFKLIEKAVLDWKNVIPATKKRLLNLLWDSIAENHLNKDQLSRAVEIWKNDSDCAQILGPLSKLKRGSSKAGFALLAILYEQMGLTLDLVCLGARFARFQKSPTFPDWLRLEAWMATEEAWVNQAVRLKRIASELASNHPENKELHTKLLLLHHYHLRFLGLGNEAPITINSLLLSSSEIQKLNKIYDVSEKDSAVGLKRIRDALASEIGNPQKLWEKLMGLVQGGPSS